MIHRFPGLAHGIATRTITNELLVESMKIQLATAPVLLSVMDDHPGKPWIGPVRGDEEYGWRRKAAIMDYCNVLDSLPGTLLFETWTVSQKKYGNRIQSAWLALKKEIKHSLRKIQRKHPFKFVLVPESHVSGFPHVHVICKFVGKTIPHYVDDKGNWRPVDPYWHLFLRKCWRMGFNDTLVVQDGGAAGYMAKYVCKGFRKQDLDGMDFTGEDGLKNRKALLSQLLPIFFRIHSCSVSRSIRTAGVALRKARLARLDAADYTDFKQTLRGLDVDLALIRLLNYRTIRCRRILYFLRPVAVKILLPDKIPREITREEWDFVQEHHLVTVCNCHSCPMIEFIKNLEKNYKEKISKGE